MNEEMAKRYERAIRRQRERLDAALAQWSAMLHALETYSEGGEVARPAVERAMREVLSVLTVPVVPCLSGSYAPAEFWEKEPVGKLLASCNTRLLANEELLSQADAARELGVEQVRVARWIAAGSLQAVPVFTKLTRRKAAVHHMVRKKDLNRERLLGDVPTQISQAEERRSGNDRRRTEEAIAVQ